MVNQAIEPTKTQNAIAPTWGERSEIRELVARFRAGLPNAKEVPEIGLLALATAAMAHGLDPWNGEIWCIYDKNKGETSLMAGIKGLRKAAKRQMTDRFFYDVSFKDVPEEEWSKYALELDEKGRKVEWVSICTLRRQDATSNYLAQLAQAKDLCGGNVEEAREMVGEQPRWIGIGIVRVGEKSRMEKTRLARKRAEAEATTQAFDLPFVNQDYNGSTVTVGVSEEAVGGEYVEVPSTTPAPASPPEQADPDPDPLARPYAPEIVRKAIQGRVAHNPTTHEKAASEKQQHYIASLLNAAFKDSPTQEKDRYAVTNWLIGKTSTKTFSAAEAKAIIDWLADETGDISQDGYTEANAILREAMLADGQMELFDDAGRAVVEGGE